jgi:hypothetical protein
MVCILSCSHYLDQYHFDQNILELYLFLDHWNHQHSKCIPCLIYDSCQLVQEVQHERSIKRSSQKGENIRKSLKQNIGITKSKYLTKLAFYYYFSKERSDLIFHHFAVRSLYCPYPALFHHSSLLGCLLLHVPVKVIIKSQLGQIFLIRVLR